MTTLREAAQQVLAAMEAADVDPHSSDAVYKAINALRAALAEPVQEQPTCDECGKSKRDGWALYCVDCLEPVFAQRRPLTEEEILKAIGWERAEMYMKLTPNFPVAEAKKETLKNARAIERAHGIGGQ